MRKGKKGVRLLGIVLIWGMMTALFAVFWTYFYMDTINYPFFERGNWAVVGIYGAILFFINQFYGGYRVGYYQRGNLIFSGIVAVLVTDALMYLQILAIGRMLPEAKNLIPMLGLAAGEILLVWLWATGITRLYLRIYPPRDLLMVYEGRAVAQSLADKILTRGDKYVIRESVSMETGMDAVLARMQDYSAVLICDVNSAQRNLLLKHCYRQGIRVYMTPKISDILIRASMDVHLFDSPLLLTKNNGLSAEQRILKRAIDVLFSAAGLLVASPLMLLVAICIRIEDGGCVFYSQERLTMGGKCFRLYKFRSMVENAEKDGCARLASQGDERITRVGRIIRAARLDELPQLYNVLKGEMSLVGPRPERPEIAREYGNTIPEFDFRLKVKAGITGYAQIIGRYNTSPYDKLKFDLMYIAGYSVMLDLKLILQTIKVLFMRESTQGVASGQTDARLRPHGDTIKPAKDTVHMG